MPLSNFKNIGFYVLAPEIRIEAGIFERQINKESIQEIVKRRVDEYDESKEIWFNEIFMLCLDRIDIQCISWESVIAIICKVDPSIEEYLRAYYTQGLKFNSKIAEKY